MTELITTLAEKVTAALVADCEMLQADDEMTQSEIRHEVGHVVFATLKAEIERLALEESTRQFAASLSNTESGS